MKYREVLTMIHEDGWRIRSQEGSHRQFTHPAKPGRVTVAGHPGHDVPKSMLASILRQAQIKPKR